MNYSRIGIDLIGDIHGHGESLEALLGKLGYELIDGVHRHPAGRRVIFLGDLIDRGPSQHKVITIVRSMVDAGTAQCVMGNHEFNAIAYCTPVSGSAKKGFLREHSDKNKQQHEAFLEAYPLGSAEHREVIEWFKTLPLWLEVDGIRVIHACWDHKLIKRVLKAQNNDNHLGDDLLNKSRDKRTWRFHAIETLLKGKEIPLPEGSTFPDKQGELRRKIRVRWWDKTANTYRRAFMGPESGRTHIPDDEIDGDHLIDYAHDASPVFLGHYWLEGDITPLASNIACLDYSVAARNGSGHLVAYRYDGEAQLTSEKFVSVPCQEYT